MSNKDTIIEALTMQLKLEREGNLALVKRIAELEKPVYVDSSRFSKGPSDHKPGMVITEPVHAIDISQERVDETAKSEHEWVGLTDEEEEDILKGSKNAYDAIKSIEAKLKEKNT
jgi:hypothetical protein